MTNTENRLNLPTLHLDYTAGSFVNTLTGEQTTEVSGVVLAYREDRVLWPTLSEAERRPLCVNGSDFGPCLCAFAVWGPNGAAPDCAEEISVLLHQNGAVVVLTARRSQVKVLTQYIEMKSLLGEVLHSQHVTVRMVPGLNEDAVQRLVLMPGKYLSGAERHDLSALAERVSALWGDAGVQ